MENYKKERNEKQKKNWDYSLSERHIFLFKYGITPSMGRWARRLGVLDPGQHHVFAFKGLYPDCGWFLKPSPDLNSYSQAWAYYILILFVWGNILTLNSYKTTHEKSNVLGLIPAKDKLFYEDYDNNIKIQASNDQTRGY